MKNYTIWVIDYLSSRNLWGRDYLAESIKVLIFDMPILAGQLTDIKV